MLSPPTNLYPFSFHLEPLTRRHSPLVARSLEPRASRLLTERSQESSSGLHSPHQVPQMRCLYPFCQKPP
nr:hypothetical protein Q903MT_gene3308 [Picea sitchensis]